MLHGFAKIVIIVKIHFLTFVSKKQVANIILAYVCTGNYKSGVSQ